MAHGREDTRWAVIFDVRVGIACILIGGLGASRRFERRSIRLWCWRSAGAVTGAGTATSYEPKLMPGLFRLWRNLPGRLEGFAVEVPVGIIRTAFLIGCMVPVVLLTAIEWRELLLMLEDRTWERLK